MRFTGKVASRSSLKPVDIPPANIAPGESKIQELNPQRRETILTLTHWRDLAAGSLNLAILDGVLSDLDSITPIWIEDCRYVTYPAGFEHIPKLRVAYFYFYGEAKRSNCAQEILVRKAKIPVEGVVELLAPVNLREHFELSDDDLLHIEVGESNNALH